MRIMNNKKLRSLLLCMILTMTMAFSTIGCSTKKQEKISRLQTVAQETLESNQSEAETQETADSNQTEATAEEVIDNNQAEAEVEENTDSEVKVLGEGQTKFLFTVVDKEGGETNFEIHTDKETVGEALLDLGLINGEDGKFGLFVKKVNGITADYDVDQTYWAFYIDGEYAMSGVDVTKIEEGKAYTFKVEK